MTRVLVVDDEPQILRALQTNLRGAGYEVVTAATAEEALASAAMRPPEAIILDLLLPDGRGTDVCRELRQWTHAPIIVLSAVGEEREKVAALDAGADDYVTKPFGDRRAARAAARRAAPRRPRRRAGDRGRRPAHRSREAVGAPRREARLADAARVRPAARSSRRTAGKLLTHLAILREVWGPAYQTESHYIHVYVSQLRRKIEPDPARPRYLLTEPGRATASSTRPTSDDVLSTP